jgi:GTP:adenosylcobinamide-phosphate guanylyltransferase
MITMDAIVTAGGVPQPGDPLYEFTQGRHKALLPIAGKPMIQWVIDALEQASLVRRVFIVGLTEDSGLSGEKIVDYLPSQGGMLDNLRYASERLLKMDPDANLVLAVSSDIPSITAPMVDWLVETAMQTDHDVYYNIITRQVMEARFPTSRRTFVKLKNMEVCGGDMNVFRARQVIGKHSIWDRIIESRKNVLKQAALIGFDTLFLLVFRSLTVEGAEKTAAKRLGLHAKALLCPYAEIGMDVDKPHQLEIMQAELGKLVAA